MAVIGVDLGGTRMRAAAVDEGGILHGFHERPTAARRPSVEILRDIAELVRQVESGSGYRAVPVGIGVPTTIGPGGRLAPCPNLPTCEGLPLARELSVQLGREPEVDNDARCFASGEWRWGNGGRVDVMVGVTLGTSVGMAALLGGRIHRGATGESGEVWRAPADLLRPEGPCLHDLLSGDAVLASWKSAREAEGASLEGGPTDAAGVARLALDNQSAALAAWRSYGRALGGFLRWVADIYDPDRIVVGGAISASWRLVAGHVAELLGKRTAILQLSGLGDHAAVMGAAALVAGGGRRGI